MDYRYAWGNAIVGTGGLQDNNLKWREGEPICSVLDCHFPSRHVLAIDAIVFESKLNRQGQQFIIYLCVIHLVNQIE